jgi:uracil phosphoribosyltransferase
MPMLVDLSRQPNPALGYFLLKMRDRGTGNTEFRTATESIGAFMGYEISKYIPRMEGIVETPLELLAKETLPRPPVLVGIARAGVPMMYGMLKAFPDSLHGIIGAARDEVTHEATLSYNGASDLEGCTVIFTDPMLATGGSMEKAMSHLYKQNGRPSRAVVASIFATAEGIDRVHRVHPDALIVTATIDPVLNNRAYIEPGCGDAGDRMYGPKAR